MNSELVSILVVTYNSANTIIETLESIKKQTYTNIEIVVTDDCSKDETIHVVEHWIVENSVNIKLVRAECNQGIPANINKGIKVCTGNLIKIIAGDDRMKQNAVQRYYEEYKKSGQKTIIQSKVELFGAVTKKNIEYCEDGYRRMQSDNQYREILKNNYIVAPSVGFIPKALLKECNGFDTRFKLMEDYPFYTKISAMGYRYELLDEKLVEYRISPESVCNKKSRRFVNCVVKYFFSDKLWRLIKEKMFGQALYQIARHTYMYITGK